MRWLIAGGALIVALIIIYEAFELGPNSSSGALLLNLGTEVLGITVTVAIVEYLLERKEHRDEARRIAWNVLHEIDHAVWIWQGGGREFDVDELIALPDEIDDGDHLPSFTQNIIMNIGSRSENTLRQRDDIMKESAELKNALMKLSPLSKVRNKTQPDMGGVVWAEIDSSVKENTEQEVYRKFRAEAGICCPDEWRDTKAELVVTGKFFKAGEAGYGHMARYALKIVVSKVEEVRAIERK